MSNNMWHVALEPGTTRMQDVILANLSVNDFELIGLLLSTSHLKGKVFETESDCRPAGDHKWCFTCYTIGERIRDGGGTMMNTKKNRYADAMYGLAIGDALGVPYEFKDRGSFECTEMVGFGSHGQPAGTWSDDTSMTIATAKSLRDCDEEVNIRDITDNFLNWSRRKDFNCNGELFDIGIATSTALDTGKSQTGEFDNGNGSLMRILPLAFTDCTDDEIRAVSAITHGHEISMQACVIYVHVARRLLAGETIQEIIPTLQYSKPFDRLDKIDQLSEDQISSTGFVVHTLEASLWVLAKYDSFKDTVLAAVNLGDDTDTTGAVAGGLAGIVYGLESDFAKECMAVLRSKEMIAECL